MYVYLFGANTMLFLFVNKYDQSVVSSEIVVLKLVVFYGGVDGCIVLQVEFFLLAAM